MENNDRFVFDDRLECTLWQEKYFPKQVITSNLDEVGRKFNSDKCNVQYICKRWRNGISDTDVEAPGHNYTYIYDQYFSKYRDKEIKLLELGIGNYPTNGYSMQMWLDYFPNIELHMADWIHANTHFNFDYDKDKVKFHIFNQGNNDDIDRMSSKELKKEYFDIIIDDASHIPSYQINTFERLFDNLKEGGLYCIEDLVDETVFFKYIQDMNNGTLINSERMNVKSNFPIGYIHFYPSLIIIEKSKTPYTR